MKIEIIRLGYVGLPLLAVEFSRKFDVVGFDVNQEMIKQLKKGLESILEVSQKNLFSSSRLKLSWKIKLDSCNVYTIAVFTPIDKIRWLVIPFYFFANEKLPIVNNIVIYESTVYSDTTEDDCIPV